MEKLWIRADGNRTLGMGHLMRCMSIADAYVEAGGECEFIVADQEAEELLNTRGYQARVLYSRWDDLSAEIGQLSELLTREAVKLLLVDSYYAGVDYFAQLREQTRIIYLTGKYDKAYPVDVLINYTIGSEQLGYEELYRGRNTRLLIGVQYAPLRKQFEVPLRHTEGVKSILVTTGGTDAGGLAAELVQRAKQEAPELEKVCWHIVIGAFYSKETRQKLQKLQEAYTGIYLYENVSEMAALMQQCELAVSAAGSTVYELCACGVPAVIFSFVDNQEKGRRDFEQAGLVQSAGDLREERADCVSRMLQQLVYWQTNEDARSAQACKVKAFIDGKGAKRLVEMLKHV